MKRNKIEFFQEFLVTQMNHFIFYPLVMTIVVLLSGLVTPVRPGIGVWFLGGLLSLLFYKARCYCKRFLPFLSIHLGVVLFVLVLLHFHSFLPDVFFSCWDSVLNRGTFLLAVVSFAVYSFYLRLHEVSAQSNLLPMPLAVGICAGSIYLQHYMQFTEWDSACRFVLILVLGMYFLHYYIKEYLNFLTVNASSTGVLPEKEIFRSGLRLAFGYTLFGAVILTGTSQTGWLKSILQILKQVIYSILRFIFSLFPQSESEIPEIIVEEQVQGGGYEMPEMGEPGIFWQILEVIACIAILLFVLFCVYQGVLRAIAFIKHAMGRNVKLSDTELTGIQDVREKCDLGNKPKKKRLSNKPFGFLEPAERIRRIYKKKVESYHPLPLSETETKSKNRYNPERAMFYTAREMEAEMMAGEMEAERKYGQKNGKGTFHIAEIYEKARYSNETCTAEDVRRMKNACHER